MDTFEKRIQAILGNDNARTRRNAERYRVHLMKRLSLPLIVTGTEDFPWEEPYVLGGWDMREYEKLKKTQPSYTDTFELQALELPDEHEDVVAMVKRISDGRVFHIGLSWLCCEDEESEAYILLDDYGVWHTNY
ncbi:hypothetical protein JXQ70_05530 [bacterium]|nr:hypothetical protein [bacterium]